LRDAEENEEGWRVGGSRAGTQVEMSLVAAGSGAPEVRRDKAATAVTEDDEYDEMMVVTWRNIVVVVVDVSV